MVLMQKLSRIKNFNAVQPFEPHSNSQYWSIAMLQNNTAVAVLFP